MSADPWQVRLGAAVVLLAVLLLVWRKNLDPHKASDGRGGWFVPIVIRTPDKLAHFVGGLLVAALAAPATGALWAFALAAGTGVGWELQQWKPYGGGKGIGDWRDALFTAAGAGAVYLWWRLWL